jgi:hypothetical protein
MHGGYHITGHHHCIELTLLVGYIISPVVKFSVLLLWICLDSRGVAGYTFVFVHCVTVDEALIDVVAVDMWRISVLGVLIPVFYLNAWPCILLTCWHVRA